MAAAEKQNAPSLPPIVVFIAERRTAVQGLSASFEASGIWVTTTTSDEAMETALELKPDLIIVAADAAAVLTSLKSHRITKLFPVLLLHSATVEVDDAAGEAAELILDESVDPAQLLASSLQLIEKKRGAPALVHEADPANKANSDLHVRRADSRECPQCAKPLRWVQRARLYGYEYDYYEWCGSGCGLYCYHRNNREWLKLA